MVLNADPFPKLVAVCAPPGYGKTVLLSKLYEAALARGSRCLWATLDDRDIDHASLLHRLRCALEYVGVEVGAEAFPLKASFADRGAPTDDMVNLLASLEGETVLFIDNLGFCEDETTTLFLERLVFAAGSRLRLVLSSTREIPVDIVRAKLEVGAVEIRASHLSFDRSSTALLLGQVGISTAGGLVLDEIVAQTEGWPAAVRLLQVLLAGEVNGLDGETALDIGSVLLRLSGDHSDIAQVLTRRVLVGFDPALVQFMIEIALVREFSADLAAEMTGRAEARDWLNMLVRRNVLIFPMDSSRRWFRFHTLMRAFLIAEGQETMHVERRREVLDKAARWHKSRGNNIAAISIALEAGSTSLAQELLDQMAHVVVGDHGEMGSLIQWVDRLIEAGIKPSLEVQAWFVWALCDSHHYERARKALDEFDGRIAEGASFGAEGGRLPARLLFLRMLVNVFIDRLDFAYEQANAWLADGDQGDALSVATVTSIAGIAEIDRGELTAARLRMERARPAIDRSDSAYGLAWVGILRACVEIGQARPDVADKLLLEVRERVARVVGNDASVVVTLDFVHARALLDLGQVDGARELAIRGLDRAVHHGIMASLEQGLISCVAFWGDTGDQTITEELLDRVSHSYPPRGRLLLGASKVRRLLELNRYADALKEAERVGLTTSSKPVEATIMRDRGDWMLARIELDLAQGLCNLVLEQVDARLKEARLQGRDRDRIELLLIAADAHQRLGQARMALRNFSMAVVLASPGKVVHPFKVRTGLLRKLLTSSDGKELGLIQPSERSFFERLRIDEQAQSATGDVQTSSLRPDDEEGSTTAGVPTLREIQLLSLLDEGLSNEQVADRMSLSVPTVKWHLHNVYGKLGVRSRSAALARARALKLVGR